jgi:hypothetical protein
MEYVVGTIYYSDISGKAKINYSKEFMETASGVTKCYIAFDILNQAQDNYDQALEDWRTEAPKHAPADTDRHT